MMRTGIGYDIHRLKKGRKFILGGIEIPSSVGEEAHSDGDVLVHAIIDSMLGAIALGDIGELFPPSDEKYKDADSMLLLQQVYGKIKSNGWRLSNIDCVVICEKPAILPFREKIRSSLASILETDIENIFVKGKTKEGLGPIGKGKAVEAYAVCLMTK